MYAFVVISIRKDIKRKGFSQSSTYCANALKVEVLRLEPAPWLAHCRAGDGNVHAAMCLERQVKQRQLRVVIAHVELHEASRASVGRLLSSESMLQLLTLCLVPVPKKDMSAEIPQQPGRGSPYALCAAYAKVRLLSWSCKRAGAI